MSASAAQSKAKPRDRSIEGRRAARRARLERERLIVDSLNRGVAIAEIAARIEVTEKRARAIVREILARRQPAAPEDHVALQISRLNEALMVAYGAMSPDNLRAVSLVVRIVRELDRYHGVSAERPVSAARRTYDPPHAEAPEADAPRATGAPMAPEGVEMARSEPDESGPAAAAAIAAEPSSDPARIPDAPAAPPPAGPKTAPQTLETAENAPEFSAPSGRAGTPLAAVAEAPFPSLIVPVVAPTDVPGVFRRMRLRFERNGVYAA